MTQLTARLLKPGETLDGKYVIEAVLGEGGMGVVYQARHTKLDQPVAIKLMLPELLAESTLVARFEREARAAAKLKSRHAARVFDVDVSAEGLPYIVMELLHGHDLSHELARQKQMPVGQAVHVLLQVCSAIREAHQRGIVHRDLKPANVFLATEGERVTAKVLDFGISKDLVASTRLTNESGVVGTALYMSPEQVRAQAVDHRTDIWSLGAMLYELLAGAPPFDGPITKVAAAIVSDEPRRLRDLRPDLPTGIGSVVRKMLSKDPNARYPDVSALMEALAPFSPSRTLDAYAEDTVSPPISNPNVAAGVTDPTGETLDADDRVVAPRSATTAGLSSDRLVTRRSRSIPIVMVASLVAIGIGAVAVVVTFRTDGGATTGATKASADPAPSAIAPPAATTPPAPPTEPEVPPPSAATTSSDAGTSAATPSSRTKRSSKPTAPRPTPPTPAPAASTKGPTPPFHL